MLRAIKHLSIRSKLLFGYSALFLVVAALGHAIVYYVVYRTIQTNIERELKNSTSYITKVVKTAADASIRNSLRAAAEKNRDIVQHYWDQSRKGLLSEADARKKAEDVLLSQTIGKTGYVYAVDSAGMIEVHPRRELRHVNLSHYHFIEQQKNTKEGYIEYEWANPGEKAPRKKALYMTYFAPWDWIVSASSYRDEFKDLFSVRDFRDSVLSVTFGRTGYSYVMDGKGTLVIHPRLEGTNIYDSRDASGRAFIQEICSKKTGKIVYPWQNPGESSPRQKLVLFTYIPELDWIVASSSYLDEFNQPLTTLGRVFFAEMIVSLLLIVSATWWFSASITGPLTTLMSKFSSGADADLSSRIDASWGGELGRLALYYNQFMEKLHESSQRLIRSEEQYRKIFDNAVEGVFQIDAAGTFLTANPSMAKMLGYESPQDLMNGIADVGSRVFAVADDWRAMLDRLQADDSVADYETQFRRRDGVVFWVSLYARALKSPAGSISALEGFCNDVTERKRAEDAQRKIQEELEQGVRDRTAELSRHICELEQRNVQAALLRELGEMLHVCKSTSEALVIIGDYSKRFFPAHPGAIFLFKGTGDHLRKAVEWGSPSGFDEAFTRESCWALRQDKPYVVLPAGSRPLCGHTRRADAAYCCVPMTAQGEKIGLMHLNIDPDALSTSAECHSAYGSSVETLAISIAGHLALALMNLQLQERLRTQSLQDPLTGLYNRRFMEDFVEREIEKAGRRAGSLAVIVLDVDHFKRFNDAHGHDAGDQILKEMAIYLRHNTRGCDVACRHGGEEFAIILPDCTLEDAGARATSLCNGIREKVRIGLGADVLSISVSMGVAAFREHGSTMREILKSADSALYAAKRGGRDRVVLASAAGACVA